VFECVSTSTGMGGAGDRGSRCLVAISAATWIAVSSSRLGKLVTRTRSSSGFEQGERLGYKSGILPERGGRAQVPACLVFGSVFTAQKTGRSSLLPVLWPWSHLLRERERGDQVRPDEPSVIFQVGLSAGGQRKERAMYIRMGQVGLAPDTSLSGSLRQPPMATAPPPVTLAMRVRPFAVFSGFELDSAVVRGQANER
jgi:hypothetical protein